MADPMKAAVQKGIQRIAGRSSDRREREADRQQFRQGGLKMLRGIVTEVTPELRIKIRRHTAVDDNGNPGPPDPRPMPLANPAVIPLVGQEVFGYETDGGPVILGAVPPANFRDLKQVDSTAGSAKNTAEAVRAGGVDDYSLLNSKFATDSQTSRTIALDAVGDLEIRNRSVQNYNLQYDSVTGNEVADRQLGNLNIAHDTLGQGEVQDYALGDQSFVTDSVGGRVVAENSISSAQITDYTIGDQSMMADSIGSRAIAEGSIAGPQISDALNGPAQNQYGLRSIGSGTGVQASGTGHTHSLNWKADFTAAERAALLSDREVVEAMDEEAMEAVMPGLGALKRLVEATVRALADEPGGVRAEVIEARLRSDRDYRHQFLLENDRNYHARWFHEVDPVYRRDAARNERILEALESCPTLECRHEEYEGPGVSLSVSWLETKVAEAPHANMGAGQTHQAALAW